MLGEHMLIVHSCSYVHIHMCIGHKACQICFTMVRGLTLMAHSRSCDLERCGYMLLSGGQMLLIHSCTYM